MGKLEMRSVAKEVISLIMEKDEDEQVGNILAENIVLCGGSLGIPNVYSHLVMALRSQCRANGYSNVDIAETKPNLIWLGASLIASEKRFDSMLTSREEYMLTTRDRRKSLRLFDSKLHY